jgi:hypothetical protein
MSKLFLANTMANWQLNVTSFSSPIFGQISTAQTKTMVHHFPIRCNQPQIEFSVQFVSEVEYENFQRFVRQHQQDTIKTTRLVWLNWAERNIDNWTGVIGSFRAGGMRRNFAPRATFVVDLVDSMVSHRTELSAIPATLWQTIYGAGMGPDAVLKPPTAAENALALSLTGEDLNGNVQAPGTSSPLPNPSQPGFNTGITAGS